MIHAFTFDRLVATGIFRHRRVCEFLLDGQRLGGIPLPDPGVKSADVGGRSYKRAQELLILANALAPDEYGAISIDDGNGARESPDFRVESSEIGNFDVEVTQLRSESTAGVASASELLERKLQIAAREDKALTSVLKGWRVNISPWPAALHTKTMAQSVTAIINHVRGNFGLAHDTAIPLPARLHYHDVSDAPVAVSGIKVSQPLPVYGQKTDIDAVGLVNKKRLKARSYRRPNVPLWLAIGITADFGQMEITIEDVAAEVTEACPFDVLMVVDNSRVVELKADFSATNDLLGRSWHEAGHAVAAVVLQLPLVGTTIERSHGSEEGFTEIMMGVPIAPLDDALFTAAGFAAQEASGFSRRVISNNVSLDDRMVLESDIAKRMGLKDFELRYEFAEEAFRNAAVFVQEHLDAVDAVAEALLAEGTLSAEQVKSVIASAKKSPSS
jgi:hypothetical protein